MAEMKWGSSLLVSFFESPGAVSPPPKPVIATVSWKKIK